MSPGTALPQTPRTLALSWLAAGLLVVAALAAAATRPLPASLAGAAVAALVLAAWKTRRELERLGSAERRLRSALDALPDGLAVYDAEDRLLLFNARYPDHLVPAMRPGVRLGRRFDEILRDGLSRGPVYHSDMGTDFVARRLAMRGEEATDHTQRLYDGRWLRIRENRTPESFRVLLTQDITEERRRDEELRLLATALEQVGDPVEITDSEQRFIYVNHAFETTTGWTQAEALGQLPQDLLSSGFHEPAYFEALLATLASGRTWQGTIINRHRDGHLIEQETTISPMRGETGAITHYVAVKRDVTAARAQARALAESEARYRAVVDAQTEFIIRVDGQSRWTFMNEAAERFVGASIEALNAQGLTDRSFVMPDDLPLFDAHLARITPENPTSSVEVRGLGIDGTVTWEHWTDTGIFDEDGNLVEIQCVGRVIDDRKRAEAERDEAERLRSAALAAALDCYIGMDESGRVVEWNPAAECTFGYTRDAAIGQPMAELIVPPSQRAAHARGFGRQLATGHSTILGRRIEVEAMRADGSFIPIELVIVRGSRGGGALFLAYLRDLSERRAAETALAESEARARSIAESVPVGLLISEIGSGRPLFINAMAREQLGLDTTELPETMRDNWADPRDRDRLVAELQSEGAVRSLEAELVLAGGRRMTALFSAARIDYAGRPALLTATVDITELRQTEAALRQSEARLNAIIAANPVAMNIARLSDRRLLFVNDPYIAMFGLEGVDLENFDRDLLYASPADRDRIYDEIAAGRDVTNFEIMLRRTDGTPVPTSLTSRGILFQGEPALVTSSVDLTALRAAQAEAARSREALHQSEKLTALGSLLAGVAHELNNPLSVVVGYSSMLMEFGAEPATLARVEKIHAAAERCARIVRTFLAMARARAPKRGPVSLQDVVLGALDLTAYSLRSADVMVETDLPAAMPLVEADADQLHQVVINLIVNAQQALLGSALPRKLAIRSWREGGEAVLEVADNGPGMEPDVAKRAFEPFFTTKPQGVGTGVGLSVCDGIVAAHGGRIVLDTAPDAGARFRVHLPLSATEAEAVVAPATDGRRSGRVLVVDDEPEIAALIAERLSNDGFEAITASSGRRALAALAAGRFDAVISDLRMPDIDGLTLAREIREHWPTLVHRVLLVTGDALGAAADDQIAEMDLPVFEKPLDLGALAAELAWRLAEGDR